MRIKRSPKSENLLMVLSPCEAQLMVSAFKSFTRMRGAELADSTEVSEMDEMVRDLSQAMDITSRIMEVMDDQ